MTPKPGAMGQLEKNSDEEHYREFRQAQAELKEEGQGPGEGKKRPKGGASRTTNVIAGHIGRNGSSSRGIGEPKEAAS